MSAALLAGEQRVVVSGPEGVGKTLLLAHVMRVLRAAGWRVAMPAGKAVLVGAEMPVHALLVDDADALSSVALRRLLAANGPAVVLAGSGALACRPKHATEVVLPALGREEARDYIAQWLAMAGRTPEELETAAMRRVVEVSGGVPRLMSGLLEAASRRTDGVIGLDHVIAAAASLGGVAPAESERGRSRGGRRWRAALFVAAMLALGADGFFAARRYPVTTTWTLRQVVLAALDVRMSLRGWLGLDNARPTVQAEAGRE